MLFLCHFPTHDRSPFHSPHPLLVIRLRFSFHVSILASPRVSPPLLPGVSLVSFPFLASGYLCLVPHLHDPGSFSSPYACVSLQLYLALPFVTSSCPIYSPRLLRPQTLQPSPISFRISVLPPRFRGSVFVARESRRSALTPLPRSGKEHRVMGGS